MTEFPYSQMNVTCLILEQMKCWNLLLTLTEVGEALHQQRVYQVTSDVIKGLFLDKHRNALEGMVLSVQ